MSKITFSILSLCFLCTVFSCKNENKTPPTLTQNTDNQYVTDNISAPKIGFPSEYIASSFDYPVGKPDAKGYYNAQPFGKNNHLGDDWNAITGGNSDLGQAIYAIGSGYVSFAEDIRGGWGNVVRIVHELPDKTQFESLYAHCDTILITKGDWVKKGLQIATIGNAHGIYLAHLHLEIRDQIGLEIGGGYSMETNGYVDPTSFIHAHR